jgi:hypothetical protein
MNTEQYEIPDGSDRCVCGEPHPCPHVAGLFPDDEEEQDEDEELATCDGTCGHEYLESELIPCEMCNDRFCSDCAAAFLDEFQVCCGDSDKDEEDEEDDSDEEDED